MKVKTTKWKSFQGIDFSWHRRPCTTPPSWPGAGDRQNELFSPVFNDLKAKPSQPPKDRKKQSLPLPLRSQTRAEVFLQTKRKPDGSDEEYVEFLHLPGKRFYDLSEIRREIQKQIVKEGQVLYYIGQLGCEILTASDVSREVIKILREDGDSIGYGDDLIAILSSFPGIKELQ
ncbi:hypothetical protein PVK06_011017 [Gossypium arboreum]|uniref:Uncharacterized protein n=1 Tax=Gossypium arboreum TaxID=29729 RepID=A0ABR0Q7Q5_GOSAR|nr:hypothetical protein PVK06_011017 [Gossypium arboreum]